MHTIVDTNNDKITVYLHRKSDVVGAEKSKRGLENPKMDDVICERSLTIYRFSLGHEDKVSVSMRQQFLDETVQKTFR